METPDTSAGIVRGGRSAAGVLATVVLVASACADPPFKPASPYDGAFTTPASVVGFPDTFTSVGQSAQLRLVTDERFNHVPRRWLVQRIDSAPCPTGCGYFSMDMHTGVLIATPTPYVRRWEIQVQMGAQWYRDTVTLRQLPTVFYMGCGQYDCGVSISHDTPLGNAIHFVDLYDANNVRLHYQDYTAKAAGATLTSRDTSIVGFVDGEWRSRFKDGTTWIVREQFGKVDSGLWRVRQQVFPPKLTCPLTASVSDTVRVAVAHADSAGVPMIKPVTTSYALTRLGDPPPAPRPISQDGSFVPTEPGDWRVQANAVHATGVRWSACVVAVP